MGPRCAVARILPELISRADALPSAKNDAPDRNDLALRSGA